MFRRAPPLEIVKSELRSLANIFKNAKETVNKVANALLMWSYGSIETNQGLAQVYSCLADLDYAYGQLLQQMGDETDEYRIALRDVYKRETDLKQMETRTTRNVKQWQQKMDRMRNSDKSNALELLNIAQKVEDAARSLKSKQEEYEVYKAKTVHDTLVRYNRESLQIINNMQIISQCKAEISQLLSETLVRRDQSLPDGNRVVENALRKVKIEPPVRDEALSREQFKTTVISSPDSIQKTFRPQLDIPSSPSTKFHIFTKLTGKDLADSMAGGGMGPKSEKNHHECVEELYAEVVKTSRGGRNKTSTDALKNEPGQNKDKSFKENKEEEASSESEPEYHEVDDITSPDQESADTPRMPPTFAKMHSFTYSATSTPHSEKESMKTPIDESFYASSSLCDADSIALEGEVTNTYFETATAPTKGYSCFTSPLQNDSTTGEIESTCFVDKSLETSLSLETASQGEIQNTYMDNTLVKPYEYGKKEDNYLMPIKFVPMSEPIYGNHGNDLPEHAEDTENQNLVRNSEDRHAIRDGQMVSTDTHQEVSEVTIEGQAHTTTESDTSGDVETLKFSDQPGLASQASSSTVHIDQNDSLTSNSQQNSPQTSMKKVKPKPIARKKKPVAPPRVERR